MRYILALLACFGLFIGYVIIVTGVMQSRSGGGAIPMLILLAAMAGTWKAITKKKG